MRRERGFTIVEFVVVMLILVVIAGFGIPAFNEMSRNNQMVNTANDTLLALQLARSEAHTRGRTVTACASSDGQTCGDNWADGWLVFVDGSLGGSSDNFEESDILRISEKSNVVTTEGGPTAVAFMATGEVTMGAGTIRLEREGCADGGAREIRIPRGGRARVRVADC